MLRKIGVVLLCLLVVAAGVCVWFLLIDGRAPAPRPDLAGTPGFAGPEAARGYPTLNAMYLGYALGWIDVVDINTELPLPDGLEEQRDVVYGHAGERPLLLDLVKPAQREGLRPGLIFIHGGGWSKGDKKDYRIYQVHFAQQGYVAASVGYRLTNEAKFPACIQDVNCAIAWMQRNGPEIGVDPERIAVIGGSAGGHLAMLAGYAPEVAALRSEDCAAGVAGRVRAVVNLYGPCDLTTPEAQEREEGKRLFGVDYADDPSVYALGSPLTHLDAGDPASLVIHGTLDDIVPVGQSDSLVERLKLLGVAHWYDRVDGWPHTLDIVRPNFLHTRAVIEDFLKRHGV